MSEAGKVSLPTPGQIEEIRLLWEEGYTFRTVIGRFAPQRVIGGLLAALEEAQQQKKTILAGHERDLSELYRIENELAEAQQTIAALEMVREEERGYHERDCIEYQQTIAPQREAIEGIRRIIQSAESYTTMDLIKSLMVSAEWACAEAFGEGAKEA